MTTYALADPTLQSNYFRRARKLLGERYASLRSDRWLAADKLAQVIKSIDHLLSAIYEGLPKGNLIIEDIVIQEDRVIVRYKSQDSLSKELAGTLSNNEAVNLSRVDVLRIGDGKVIGRWDPVYQIKELNRAR